MPEVRIEATEQGAEYQETVRTLIEVYKAQDKPHYGFIIERAAMELVGLHKIDREGGSMREYNARNENLLSYLNQLMKYTEAIHLETNLRKAQEAQENLMRIVKRGLCPECLERVSIELGTDNIGRAAELSRPAFAGPTHEGVGGPTHKKGGTGPTFPTRIDGSPLQRTEEELSLKLGVEDR